jgi:hypothetical protein
VSTTAAFRSPRAMASTSGGRGGRRRAAALSGYKRSQRDPFARASMRWVVDVWKGLEWPKVCLGDDFRGPRRDKNGREVLPGRDELMLAYVAVTRAKKRLDVGSLGWVDRYVPQDAAPVVPAAAEPAAVVVPEPRRHVGAGTGLARALKVLRAAQERAARPGYTEDERITDAEAIIAAYLDQGVRPDLRVVGA